MTFSATATPPSPSTAFWDRIAPKYFKRAIADESAYEAALATTRGLLKPTDRVLEVGCGTGGTAVLLAPDVAHLTATDLSPGMIRLAQGRLADGAPDNIEFRTSPAEATVPGAPFDAVLAHNLLHLVTDVDAALASLHRQIRPGGLFISKTPCLSEMSVWMRPVIWVVRTIHRAPEVLFFRNDQLERAIRAAGFEIEMARHFGKQKHSRYIVARKT